jgi:hypothetical protein
MSTTEEIEIRNLVEAWARAIRDKNLTGILAHHSSHVYERNRNLLTTGERPFAAASHDT